MADYPKQLRERITKFREQKGVSESRMSRELGQSKCYLQQISSEKRCLPWEHFSGYVNILRRYR